MSSGPVATTERLLRGARDQLGRDPYQWLATPLRDGPTPVLDVLCGTAPTRSDLPGLRWVGVDPDGDALLAGAAAGRGPLVRADPTRLPIASSSISTLCLALCLPQLGAMDALFAELRRVLRAGGTVFAMVPSRPRATLTELRAWRALSRALGEGDGWPTASARDRLGWILAAADFAVLGDDRVTFWLPLPDVPSADALVDGLVAGLLWPSGVPAERVQRAKDVMRGRVGPDRHMPIPLRRVVARR